jgi:hypothetical protein
MILSSLQQSSAGPWHKKCGGVTVVVGFQAVMHNVRGSGTIS